MSGKWMRIWKEAATVCFRAGLITNTSGRGTEEIHSNYHSGDPGRLFPAFSNYCYINILDFRNIVSRRSSGNPFFCLRKQRVPTHCPRDYMPLLIHNCTAVSYIFLPVSVSKLLTFHKMFNPQ
jgi:hypothetical protein